MIPIGNRTTMMIASTATAVSPWVWMSRTVSVASAATNSSAIVRTARRKASVDRVAGRDLPAPRRQQLDRGQAERETADVGEVGDAAARPRRRGQAGRREHRLFGEPDAEHHDGRQLDHGEEEDQDHEREHAGSWIQHDVAAQYGRDRARGPERGGERVRADRDLEGQGGDPAEDVEEEELDRAHRVLDVVAED